MHTLQELWYGNIHPCEKPIQRGGEYARALHKFAEEKERLIPDLSPELQKIFEMLMDIQMEAAVIAERDAFVTGFRLATQLLMEECHQSFWI